MQKACWAEHDKLLVIGQACFGPALEFEPEVGSETGTGEVQKPPEVVPATEGTKRCAWLIAQWDGVELACRGDDFWCQHRLDHRAWYHQDRTRRQRPRRG